MSEEERKRLAAAMKAAQEREKLEDALRKLRRAGTPLDSLRSPQDDFLPTSCAGGFVPVDHKEEPIWHCPTCSASAPWECQELPERRGARLADPGDRGLGEEN